MTAPDFWDNAQKAQEVIAACNERRAWLTPYSECKSRFAAVQELLPEAIAMGDEAMEAELIQEAHIVDDELSKLEIRKMLSGELDPKCCYININAGAGGTESCDWALMLSRMYERWAARRGWKIELMDRQDGDVAGIKSATYLVSGPFAYGYCKSERGVHRLVRISPFDSAAKRHTSFASVDVTPEITDDIQIEIRPEDVRIECYRASGAGGQHVNTTDSAVRITHLKTGIVVYCSNERSQFQNKETCWKMLRSKLYEQEVLEREKALRAISGKKLENSWGSQIRNYVFQPYTLVKDARTKFETGNVQAVMDGDIDGFVNAYLKEFG